MIEGSSFRLANCTAKYGSYSSPCNVMLGQLGMQLQQVSRLNTHGLHDGAGWQLSLSVCCAVLCCAVLCCAALCCAALAVPVAQLAFEQENRVTVCCNCHMSHTGKATRGQCHDWLVA